MRHVFILSFFLFFSSAGLGNDGAAAHKTCLSVCKEAQACINDCNSRSFFSFDKVKLATDSAASIPSCKLSPDFVHSVPLQFGCNPDKDGKLSFTCYEQNRYRISLAVKNNCNQAQTAAYSQAAAAAQQARQAAAVAGSGSRAAGGNQSGDQALFGAISQGLNAAAKHSGANSNQAAGQNTSSTATGSSKNNNVAALESIKKNPQAASNGSAQAQGSLVQSAQVTQAATSTEDTKQQLTSDGTNNAELASSKVSSTLTAPGTIDAPAVIAAGEAAKSTIVAAGKDVTAAIPDARSAVDQLSENADGAGAAIPQTDISVASKAKSNELQGKVSAAMSSASTHISSFEVPYSTTANALKLFNQEVKTYILSLKETCTSAASKTEFLCMEGTSPGVKAAKAVMTVAGPALGAMNAAQKACSGTANVTKLLGAGLAVANGVCVASKIYCDTSCAAATTHLKKLQAAVPSEIGGAIETDFISAQEYCNNLPEKPSAACLNKNAKTKEDLIKDAQLLKAALNNEQQPIFGTSPSIALKCQQHMKDILSMVANIAGLLQANKSAKECSDNLASAPSNVTTAQYCDIAANRSTTICKCQINDKAEGCPGAIASGAPPSTLKDESGNDIKSKGGANNFAGGMAPVKPDPIDLSGKKPNAETPSGDKAEDGVLAGNQSGFVGGSAGSPSAGGSGGSSEAAGNDSKAAAAEKKKFSLGAFFGLGGGSTGSGKSGSSNNAGAIGQKDMDAVKRKIASEKLRAEISGATGKSNWEKVNERYLRNKSTLLIGQ